MIQFDEHIFQMGWNHQVGNHLTWLWQRVFKNHPAFSQQKIHQPDIFFDVATSVQTASLWSFKVQPGPDGEVPHVKEVSKALSISQCIQSQQQQIGLFLLQLRG